MACCLLATAALQAPADAGEAQQGFPYLDELRFGLSGHNVEASGNESGLDANVEVLFQGLGDPDGTGALARLLDPRLHIGADISAQGETSRLYLGVTWDMPVTETLFIEASFGGVLHNGPLDETGEASYGCRLNFREAGAVGLELGGPWRILATVEHMSNANLCARNRGLTSAGVRLGYSLQ